MRIYVQPHAGRDRKSASGRVERKAIAASPSRPKSRNSTPNKLGLVRSAAASPSLSKTPPPLNSTSTNHNMMISIEGSINNTTNEHKSDSSLKSIKSAGLSDITNSFIDRKIDPDIESNNISTCAVKSNGSSRAVKSRQEKDSFGKREAKVDLPNQPTRIDTRRQFELSPLRKALKQFMHSDETFLPEMKPFAPGRIPSPSINTDTLPRLERSKHSILPLLRLKKTEKSGLESSCHSPFCAKVGAQTQTTESLKGNDECSPSNNSCTSEESRAVRVQNESFPSYSSKSVGPMFENCHDNTGNLHESKETDEGAYSYTFLSYNSAHSPAKQRSGYDVCDESKSTVGDSAQSGRSQHRSFHNNESKDNVDMNAQESKIDMDERIASDIESKGAAGTGGCARTGQFLLNNDKGCAWVFDFGEAEGEQSLSEPGHSSSDEEEYDSSFLSE